MSDEQEIDMNEFGPGVAVNFHHMNGCETCAKLQRMVIAYGKLLESNREQQDYISKQSGNGYQHAIEIDKLRSAADYLLAKLMEAKRST